MRWLSALLLGGILQLEIMARWVQITKWLPLSYIEPLTRICTTPLRTPTTEILAFLTPSEIVLLQASDNREKDL